MEGGGRICTLAIAVLCLMPDFAFSSAIVQGPQNATVLSGSNISFSCTVEANWKSISWSLQDVYSVNIIPTGTTIESNYQIMAQNSTNHITGEFTTTITLINVKKSNSGVVQCWSLSTMPQDAYLSVQVKGSVQITNGSLVTVTPNATVLISCRASGWHPDPTITWDINSTAASNSYYNTDFTSGTDGLVTAISTFKINPEWDTNLTCLATVPTLNQPESTTVAIEVRQHVTGNSSGLTTADIILIAVFVSLGGLLILAIIIAIIVICCKKRKKNKKETGYQSEAWRGPQQDASNLRSPEREFPGEQVNRTLPGAYVNHAFTPEPVSIAPSFRSNHSDFTFSEATSAVETNPYQVPGTEWTDDHLKQIRHLTHV